MSERSIRTRVGNRVTIYPRGKTQIYVADFWHDGKHHRQSLETRNLKVATQKAVKLDAQLAADAYQSPPPPTAVEQAVADYIAFLRVEGRARRTIVRYQCELNNLRDFLKSLHVSRLSQISPTHFDKFRAHCKGMGHGPRTLWHESVVVKQWFKWCHRRRLVAENTIADYKITKPILEPRGGPSLEQIDKVLQLAPNLRKLELATLAFTGMRSGELQRLLPEDVDLKHGWIKIVSREGGETKTRRSRLVPIHPRLRAMLDTLPKTKRAWFFTAQPSERYPGGEHWINTKRLNEDFAKLLVRLGMPVGRKTLGFTIHSLRHFFETFCVNAGIPQRVIDTWLGHSSDRSMASIYYRLSEADSKAFMDKVPFGSGLAIVGLNQGTTDDQNVG